MSSSPTEHAREASAGPGAADAPAVGGGPGVVDVTMPQMGVSVAEGTIVEWRRTPGEAIAADETICEISTDKIDTEVPAPVAGTVREILVPVGETVSVGTVLARIAVGGAGGSDGSSGTDGPDGASRSTQNAEIGTASEASAAMDPPSDTAAPKPGATDTDLGTQEPAPGLRRGARGRYSPVVLRIAAEHGIDLERVTGSGRGGRVRKQDVLAHVEQGGAGDGAGDAPLHIESPYRPDPSSATGAPVPAAATGVAQPLSRMRRSVGQHMKHSLETAATCTTWIEVDMTRVEQARARLGLTALPLVARCAIETLRAHPALNAWLEGESFTQHADVNLGIAVSLGDDGLIVPVIHAAQDLSAEGLAKRIKDLARRARARELTPDDVRGGTFTITNPGQFGSIMATPIINQPQVAILDLEAIVKRPVVLTDADGNDSIAVRPMTILGLSWDHRALDGAIAAQFLARLRDKLESWDA